MPDNTISRFYFDANALFKYYQDQKGSLNIRRLTSMSDRAILVSPLTLLESFGVIMKYYRKKYLRKGQVKKLFKRIRRDTGKTNTHRPFELSPIPDNIFLLAQSILLEHASIYDFGSNDALHLAILKKLKEKNPNSFVMVTSDSSMKKVCERISIAIYDPEISLPPSS